MQRSWRHIAHLEEQPSLTILGLMSGTSADGLDWCLVRFDGLDRHPDFQVLAAGTHPYPPEFQHAFQTPLALSLAETARLHFAYGRWLTETLAPNLTGKPDLIASHGQTILHRPPEYTLQIGSPLALVQQFGTPVVHDFRAADIVAGGEGAPLIPVVDDLLFRHRQDGVLAVNIGGIANLTILPPPGSRAAIRAWDTGPGNTLIDRAVRIFSGGDQAYDAGGGLAASARPDPGLLEILNRHPFCREAPPKSAGQEEFGEDYFRSVLADWGTPVDKAAWMAMLASFTEFTADRIYREWASADQPVSEIWVSGGGSHNETLLGALSRHFEPIPVHVLDFEGVTVDNKEAFGFAYLGYLNLRRLPGGIRSVTGARSDQILGQLAW